MFAPTSNRLISVTRGGNNRALQLTNLRYGSATGTIFSATVCCVLFNLIELRWLYRKCQKKTTCTRFIKKFCFVVLFWFLSVFLFCCAWLVNGIARADVTERDRKCCGRLAVSWGSNVVDCGQRFVSLLLFPLATFHRRRRSLYFHSLPCFGFDCFDLLYFI